MPKVPGIDDTELGCIIQKKIIAAIGTGGSLDDENLQKLTKELVSICAAQGVALMSMLCLSTIIRCSLM